MTIIGQVQQLFNRHIVTLELEGCEAGIILKDVAMQVYWGLQKAPTRWVLLGPVLFPSRTNIGPLGSFVWTKKGLHGGKHID